MNIKEEKMLFYNDLLEYRVSKQGQLVNEMFNCLESNIGIDIDMKELEKAINDYYVARNSGKLQYYSDDELEYAKKQDEYLARLYREQN